MENDVNYIGTGKGLHNGLDIAVPVGTDVYASTDGKITKADYDDVNGYNITIDYGNGLQMKYAHLKSLNGRKAGDTVSGGDVIALSGNTGYSSGPHLHLSVIRDGVHVDPAEYFSFN